VSYWDRRTPPSYRDHEGHMNLNNGGTATIRTSLVLDETLTYPVATLELAICDDCGYVAAVCDHVRNSWNKDGTQLTCDFCGQDGT
jgi:hypothetical protein